MKLRRSITRLALATLLIPATTARMCIAVCPNPNTPEVSELIIKMPYPDDITYEHDCNQGPCGSTSHSALFTQYALDMDTPNDGEPRVLLAPINGIAYAYDTPEIGVGRHVKIDVGDRTYIVMGHLHDFFIPVSQEGEGTIGTSVRQGQEIVRENNSCEPKPRCSGGDHVHLDRLWGRADKKDIVGDVSVPYKIWTRRSGDESEFRAYNPSELICCDKCPNYDSNNTAGCSTPFHDLDCWHWAYDYWITMKDEGIFSGSGCPLSAVASKGRFHRKWR